MTVVIGRRSPELRVSELADHGGTPIGAHRNRDPVTDGTGEFSLGRFRGP